MAVIYSSLLTASPLRKELNEGWKFRQARLTNWYPAHVPGVVHTDLLANGIIEDPFFRLNERGLQWIDKEDWIYETRFTLSPEMEAKQNIRLDFKGLDTYADVYLNDRKILSADNMFRQWQVDIKEHLQPGENTLKIYFHSPLKIDIPQWDSLPFQYEAGNDQSENGGVFDKKVSVFARKAGYHYGWDWGPRLVTSGIWRPVYIEAWDNLRIENIHIVSSQVSEKSAKISVVAEIQANRALENVLLTVRDGETGKRFGTVRTTLQKGLNRVTLTFTVRNPKLWWSNGLGTPHLYRFQTEIELNGQTADSCTVAAGIRSLRLVTQPDKAGRSFYFELNGVPVFAKGANYIPCDNFLPRVSRATYEKTIKDAVDANMNMLRVWGGGTYEDDYFYELCDKYGIMVWQDFMFACSLYPAEGELLENIRQEAIDNVRRLRNHPCIALWCGNNECNDAWFGWGWKRKYERQNPEYAQKIWKQFTDQYHVVLPEVVKEYAPGTDYRPSSPFSTFGNKSNDHDGDRHYWEVWHGKVPITNYNRERSRFFSEYGFQSFPEFQSVKQYAPNPEDWNITSEVMMSHQRGGAHANNLIETYLLNEYGKPRDFESFLYMNHLLQGDAIKTAIEAHRRDMPYCMGTLFWQHNDCWPVASWSSRDYYGRWKAQHYFAREAYRDLLVSPIAQNDTLYIYTVSDRRKTAPGNLQLTVSTTAGDTVAQYLKNIRIPAQSSYVAFAAPVTELLKGHDKKEVILTAQFRDKDGNSYENQYFLVQQKDMNYQHPTIKKTIAPCENGFEVTLTSDKFARGVFLSIEGIDNFFENNYFDLLPGKAYRVKVQTSLSQPEFEKQLKIISLTDAYASQPVTTEGDGEK